MTLRLQPSHTRTLGAHLESGGVHFALAAPNAHAVQLCLFDAQGQQETQRLDMPACTDGVWHGWLAGASAGLVYGWRVHGPWDPANGHRFNPAKLLLDPCARAVLGRYGGEDVHLGHVPGDPARADPRDNAAQALKACVVEDLPAARAGVRVAPAERVIYELHVKGFSALHPHIPQALRGTYAGLAQPAALAHLQRLGVTTVCLMPLALRADEVRLQRLGLSNYWGYSPIAWNAPETRYWSGQSGSTPRSELRALIDALHHAGLEVILDVVYNHTGETDELGPTLSLRGVDNATYYQLQPQAQYYQNWTGCGNCVNVNHPLVLRTVMDSLRGWVGEFGVDGFRFDLAPVLARGDAARQHQFAHNAAFLMAAAQDPVLRDCLLVAEPWDIGPGGYQLGAFPPGWLEWNDRFRDVQRGFWLQRCERLAALAQRLAGSSDAFDPQRRGAHSSVNLVTAHDGFTLRDLVSYAQRHNEANGEGNRDGHGHNLSVNNGVEGPSEDPAIVALRQRQQRVLLATCVLALGTPMLLAGDEIGHTQQGNNNAYCQDNAITWLNWAQADHALTDFVAALLRVRRKRTRLRAGAWWQDAGAALVPGQTQALWRRPDGSALTPNDWHDAQQQALQLRLSGMATGADAGEAQATAQDADCLLLVNGSDRAQAFVLPTGAWFRHIDSAGGDCQDLALPPAVTLAPQSLWLVSAARLD